MVTSYSRGHKLYWNGRDWVYTNTGEIFDESRPCKRCGKMPTPEGHDACLGHREGVTAACCGHGVDEPYAMSE